CSVTLIARLMLGIGGRHPIVSARDAFICRAEFVIVAVNSATGAAHDVALTRRLPKQCRNFGTGARATQHAVHITAQ
ncbi:MAG TPA: hypothetical protein VK678_05325, partial [Bradyrhizobium sp.]|nr:hypothetical protein [Bradyrhizobium sp.]